MPPQSAPTVIFWHRTDLRLHDNPALQTALSLNPSTFIPIFTWDPHYAYRVRVGPNRWRFLLECQNDLSQSYSKLNPKQKLWVVREAPQTVFPKLFKAWGATHLVFESDTDGYARERDETVTKLAKEAGVEVIVKSGRTLFDSDEVVKQNKGEPTMSIHQVEKAIEQISNGVPDRPVDAPETIPDPLGEEKMRDISGLEHEVPDQEDDINAAHRTKHNDNQYKNITGPKGDFSVPTLDELSIDLSQATSPHHGGESIALEMLRTYLQQNEDFIATFEKPKTSPAAFHPQATTLLSPHLHFGSLSVRKFWHDVQDTLQQRESAHKPTSDLPTNLPGQLLFREMFFAAQAALGPVYAQTRGNKIVRFIPWHLQSNHDKETGVVDRTYTVDDEQAEVWFRRWKEGRTGFPWIDALMRQLKNEGWIHHLGRHSVACFLTRGGCYVHWERGAEVFEEWLIDRMYIDFILWNYEGDDANRSETDETASNVGNWMWLSCTAFFTQYNRCYSPVAFGKKWDPEGRFVRHYIPELEHYDKKYIYEPWKAPLEDQKRWKCRVTGDGMVEKDGETGLRAYPEPMFDFDERRQTCIAQMKEAYGVHLMGNDEKVMDGSWKEIFEYEVKDGRVVDETNVKVDEDGGDHKGGEKRGRQAGDEDGEDADGGHGSKKKK
ncbi:cryptochrome-2 [Aspergillus niger]|nr:cryptochrome-2 [Aspergillus niger]